MLSLMKRAVFYVVGVVFTLSLPLTHAGCSLAPASSPLPNARVSSVAGTGVVAARRILFVGNSYLYYNDSVHNHVRRIAEELGPLGPGEYHYKSATIGGARLSQHPIDSLLEPGRLGVMQPFDLVILQGGSMEPLSHKGRAQFRETVAQLYQKISAAGAEMALYMTHAYVEPHPRYTPKLMGKIERAYVAAGEDTGALVIPVGLAFELAYERRPEIQLHKKHDGSHPSLLGTYLAACVVYRSLYGVSTAVMNYDYFGAIDAADAEFLRAIADETVETFLGQTTEPAAPR